MLRHFYRESSFLSKLSFSEVDRSREKQMPRHTLFKKIRRLQSVFSQPHCHRFGFVEFQSRAIFEKL